MLRAVLDLVAGRKMPTLAALAKQWKGDTLLIEVEYNVPDANASYGVSQRTASLVYDAGKDTLANQ